MAKAPMFLRKARALATWYGKDFKGLRTTVDREIALNRLRAKRRMISPSERRVAGIRREGMLFLTTFPKTVVGGKRGKQFIVARHNLGHESPVSIMMSAGRKGSRNEGFPLIKIDIGFRWDAVIVEAMKGEEGVQKELEQFRQLPNVQKMPAINFALKKIEEHARKTGFRQVKICVPESLDAYRKPEILGDYPPKDMYAYWSSPDPGKLKDLGPEIKAELAGIRGQMLKLYEAITKAMGYTRRGEFYVKNL